MNQNPGFGHDDDLDDLDASLENVHVECPNCGRGIEIEVDPQEGVQEYVEDCRVCCRPMTLRITNGEDGPFVEVRGQDE